LSAPTNPDSENSDSGPHDMLQEYIESLSSEDRELIGTLTLVDTDQILSMTYEELEKKISNSLPTEKLEELTNTQLERREEIMLQIRRIRCRLIIRQCQENKHVINTIEEMLQKVGITGLDENTLLQLKKSVVIG
jgi:hypothetical protein